MEVHFVHEQVDGNPVIQGNSHHGWRGEDFYLFFFDRDVQVLSFLEDGFADLFFGVVIYHRKLRLLLHFVSKLVFRYVGRKKLESREDTKDENRGNGDRFESAFAALCMGADLPPFSADLEHQNASQRPTDRNECGQQYAKLFVFLR